jgi:hypothetical protein
LFEAVIGQKQKKHPEEAAAACVFVLLRRCAWQAVLCQAQKDRLIA